MTDFEREGEVAAWVMPAVSNPAALAWRTARRETSEKEEFRADGIMFRLPGNDANHRALLLSYRIARADATPEIDALCDTLPFSGITNCDVFVHRVMIRTMNTIAEIELAIERLPESQVAELAVWLEQHRQQRASPTEFDRWLNHARGVAKAGVTTDEIMAITRDHG